ncbi:MAG: insulinase family protein [Spirochaetaceae bacterium]|nr:insulinase family protein [Spirochaetaceae bacterium]
MAVETQILSNNVVLVTESVATVKTAAVGFWFPVGSRYEGEGQRGVCHFVEHMVFKGTTTRSAFDIALAFDRMGGYLNAFTDRETMCLHCVIPAIHLRQALEVMVDMASNSVFDQKELERERAVIQSEIVSSQDDPEEAALDAASEAVWPAHPLSAPIAGTVEEVGSLTRETLVDWYRSHIVSGPLVICAAGNLDQQELLQVAEGLPLRQGADEKESFEPEWRQGIQFRDAPFRQMQFFLQLPVLKPSAARDYYCWAVANALVGDTMSSRLFQKLREEGGYSYNVYSFMTYYSDAACWCAYASAARKDSQKVVATLYRELYRLKTGGFSRDELEAACQHVCGEEIIAAEDMEYRSKRLFRHHSFGFPQSSTEEIVELIHSLTSQEVEATLDGLLDFHQAALLVYGSNPSESFQRKISASVDEARSAFPDANTGLPG